MKRLFILLFTLLLITGCVSREPKENAELDARIEESSNRKETISPSINDKLINKTEKKEIVQSLHNEYHPIVVNGLLIGGSKDYEWIEVTSVSSSIKGNEEYTVVDDKYNVTTGIGGKIEEDEVTGAEYIRIEEDNFLEGATVSYSGTWNPFPRTPEKLSNDIEIYRKVTKDVLMKHGLDVQEPQINAIYRLDFEGDEVDEVIIEASYFRDNELSPAPRKGNYSLIFLRKIVGNEVKNIDILSDIYTEDLPSDEGISYLNKILSLIDLNGDGKMEVVIRSEYYEGYGIIVYELNGDQIKYAISNGDGL